MATRSLVAALLALVLAGVAAQTASNTMGGMAMGARAAPGPAINSTCVAEPTGEGCETFEYPDANAVADMTSLCKAMPFMAACSVFKACNDTGVTVSEDTPDICSPFQHVATICRLDEGMSRMQGCTNFNSMCANGSLVEMCQPANATGLTMLPTTRTLNSHVKALCAANSSRAGCEECNPSFEANRTWADCDLLVSYAELCKEDDGPEECVEFIEMCEADHSLWVCEGFDHEGHDHDHDHAHGNSTTKATSAAAGAAPALLTMALLAGAALLA